MKAEKKTASLFARAYHVEPKRLLVKWSQIVIDSLSLPSVKQTKRDFKLEK